MSSATIIDGAGIAAGLNRQTAAVAGEYLAKTGAKPSLAVVLVGENPASAVYVKNKIKTARAVGIASIEHRLPVEVTQAALLDLITRLNEDNGVHGILVQLPLPPQINPEAVIAAVSPRKDVDGFHPINAGLLNLGQPSFVPCTPLGCMHLIKSVRDDPAGLNAVVIGRSNIVGKPMAQLLLAANCTVTIAHSQTRGLPALAASADILVAAIGRPEMVRGEWIKPGATVIDVGINRVSGPEGKTKLTGDVHFESASQIAGAITPVPGGVGPMTVAMLMVNTCRAAYIQSTLSWPGTVIK